MDTRHNAKLKSGQVITEDSDPVVIRRKQLRLAKRRQREREKQRDLVTHQLRLPRRLAEKLKAGVKQGAFMSDFQSFIDSRILCIDDFENLRLLAWNRSGRFVTRAEAFQLYESNWRHVDLHEMSTAEHELIMRLKQEYGNGVIHA